MFAFTFRELSFFFSIALLALPANAQNTDVDATYQQINAEYNDFIKRIPASLKRRLDAPVNKGAHSLTDQQQLWAKKYRYLQARRNEIQSVFGLKEALNSIYIERYPNAELTALNRESSRIAQNVIPEIERLGKTYKLFGSPIIHNILINAGIRNRGACKDWAEDILTFLKTVPRHHFAIVWGEANPEKITEHNVAVLIPKGGVFADGLMIDPWRTKGKPFWLRVAQDKHYKWHQWDEFGEH